MDELSLELECRFVDVVPEAQTSVVPAD